MRRRRINILLRRGATLTEGIDRMKTYKRIMNGLTKVEEFVLCVITVVVTAITFINVLSRYVFHSNFAWSEELVINVFILMIMLGCALATRDGSMITLSLIFDNVGVGGKKMLTAGNQTDGIQALMDGTTELSMHSNLIYSAFDPRFNVVSLPFVYDSYDDADAKFDGEAGAKLKEIFSEYGLHFMGIAEHGFREITNSKHEIKSVDDMKNLKVRVAGSNLLME